MAAFAQVVTGLQGPQVTRGALLSDVPKPGRSAFAGPQAKSMDDSILLALCGFSAGCSARVWRQRRRASPQMTLVASPPETFELMVKKGESNAAMSVLKTLHSSFMGGCYVGLSGLLSVVIGGNSFPGNVTAQTVIFAALFPINLLLVLQSGGQLFTGNTATMSMAYLEGKIKPYKLAKSWVTSYIGNTLGCLAIAFAANYCHLLTGGAADMAMRVAIKKTSYTFGQTVVKAIMCNWLVCMAVWLSTSAQDLTSKMVGIWFPISMFIMIGFEHSVANLFMLPAGLLSGVPLTVGDILYKNLLPVTIGNALAGAIILGAGSSFAFGKLGAGQAGSFRGIMGKKKEEA